MSHTIEDSAENEPFIDDAEFEVVNATYRCKLDNVLSLPEKEVCGSEYMTKQNLNFHRLREHNREPLTPGTSGGGTKKRLLVFPRTSNSWNKMKDMLDANGRQRLVNQQREKMKLTLQSAGGLKFPNEELYARVAAWEKAYELHLRVGKEIRLQRMSIREKQAQQHVQFRSFAEEKLEQLIMIGAGKHMNMNKALDSEEVETPESKVTGSLKRARSDAEPSEKKARSAEASREKDETPRVPVVEKTCVWEAPLQRSDAQLEVRNKKLKALKDKLRQLRSLLSQKNRASSVSDGRLDISTDLEQEQLELNELRENARLVSEFLAAFNTFNLEPVVWLKRVMNEYIDYKKKIKGLSEVSKR